MADTSKLLINGNDAIEAYGITMGSGFLDTLFQPYDLKDSVENVSRLEHGKRVVITTPKASARTNFSLTFHLQGTSREDFLMKYAAFLAALYAGAVDIAVPRITSDVFHLVYKKSTDYAREPSGTFCKIVATFDEPNPANRTATSTNITVIEEESE